MLRDLPTLAEAADILTRRRTRPARRHSPPLGKSLSPLLKTLNAKFGHGPGALQARWREIVGETLAKHTEPVKISGGRGGTGSTLELRVAGPAAAIVQHQAPEILSRVSMVLGSEAVTRLRIVQGPVRNANPGKSQTRKRSKGPLDAAAEQTLAKGVETQPDGPLKDALIRLGREVMRGR